MTNTQAAASVLLSDDEREAFEEAFKQDDPRASFDRVADDYRNPVVRIAWHCWQAARASSSAQAVGEPQWIVNDLAELGVKIGERFFFLYKGDSIEYGAPWHADNHKGGFVMCEEEGRPMMWRPVFKREFGECCHPVNYKDPTRIGAVSLDDSAEWKPVTVSPAEAVQPVVPGVWCVHQIKQKGFALSIWADCSKAEFDACDTEKRIVYLSAPAEAVQPVAGDAPIDMVLHCPACGMQHIDAPDKTSETRPVLYADAWTNPPHRSHLCHGCGHIWRPADVPTNGVERIKTAGKADSALARPASPSAPGGDAVRLDWIERQGSEFSLGIVQDQPGDGLTYVHGFECYAEGKTLRDAIDAQIAQAKGAGAAQPQKAVHGPADGLIFTPEEARRGYAFRGNTKHYCCYGMYCDAGHTSNCEHHSTAPGKDQP